MPIYNASKFAVVGLTESLRMELEPQGIGVSLLCPGLSNTGIMESTRVRPPELGGQLPADEGTRAFLATAGLDPEVVGEIALAALRNDEFYIFTHPDLRAEIDARHSELVQGLERAAARRAEH